MEEEEKKESFLDLFELDFGKYKTDTEEKKGSPEDERPVVEEIIPTEVNPEESKVKVELERETPTETKPETSKEVTNLNDLMEKLAEEEVLFIDEEKEYDLSFDGLKDMIEETKAKTTTKAIEDYENNFDEEGKKILEILRSGGSIEDYIASKNQVDFSSVPLHDSEGNPITQNQIYLLEDLYKMEGYEKDEIAEKIDVLTKAGLLEKEANIARKKLSSWQKEQEQVQEKQKLEENRIRVEAEKKEAEEFKNQVLNLDEVAGFKIDKKQAEKLYDYITKPIDKEGNTQFKKDDTFENRMLYAYFAMIGFDKEQLSKEIRTKQAINFKKKLSNYKDSNASPSSGDYTRRVETSEKLNLPEWIA